MRAELDRLDVAVYAAVAATPTPKMDAALRRLSLAANYSRLWLGCSALLAAFGGERGRRATQNGLAAIALSSGVVNVVLKPLGNRHRPDRDTQDVPVSRQVDMPSSTSWPSGHSASGFAFATGVGGGRVRFRSGRDVVRGGDALDSDRQDHAVDGREGLVALGLGRRVHAG